MRTSVFSSALPIVAAALGDKAGVTVKLTDGCPHTDCASIWLPRIDAKSPDEERSILGVLCHECGHVRFTDKKALSRATSAFEGALRNALEDVRIEREMCSIYPGAESLIRAAHESVLDAYARSLAGERAIPMYMLVYAERHGRNLTWMDPFLDVIRERLLGVYGPRVVRGLERYALEVNGAQSSRDVCTLSRRIMTFLKKVLKEETSSPKEEFPNLDLTHQNEEEPESGKTDKGFSGLARKTFAPGTRKAENEEKSSSECETDAGTSSCEDLSQEDLGKSSKHPGSCGSEKSSGALENLFSNLNNEDFNENPLDLSKHFAALKTEPTSEVHPVEVPLSAPRPVVGNAKAGLEKKRQAYRESLPLRAALRAIAAGNALTGMRASERGRHISKHLALFLSGDTRIFERSAEKKAPNAAVHILLDMSGSMGVEFGEAAVRASLALLVGLQSIQGVKTAYTVFPASACGHQSRRDPVCSLLRFGESFESLDPGYIGVLDPWGGTPLAEAIAYAGVTLQARRETKRIILVITDGSVIPERCIPEVNRLKAQGIQFLGIQIGEENVLSSIISDSSLIGHTGEAIGELKNVLFHFAKSIVK